MSRFITGMVLGLSLALTMAFASFDNVKQKFKSVEKPSLQISNSEMACLVENIYFEAGNQPWIGKLAVAYVTVNRAKSDKYPDNVCSVVWQRLKACQFTWTCHAYNLKRRTINEEWWAEAVEVANHIKMKYDPSIDPTKGSLFYHADYVRPEWRKRLKKVVQIEDHIFYK